MSTQHLKKFFSGTLLSRISGLGRDLVMAISFGDLPQVAAFMVAFRFSNLLRRLLGEGPFQSAFIPQFEEIRSKNPSASYHFFRQLTFLISLLLIGITVLGEIGLHALNPFLNPDNQEIASLTAYLLPGLLFICLYGLNLSILNCHDRFFLPSFAPFVCNLIWIAAAYLLRHQDPNLAMRLLSIWVAVGFFAQWLLTLPSTLALVKGSWKEWTTFCIPKEVKQLIQSFAYGAIGVGAVQINALCDSLFARHASLSGPVYLWYSIRLQQLAFALFGIACVSTIVPRLSRAIKQANLIDASKAFNLSYNRIIGIMLPCALAIFVLGLPAVNLIYGRGAFSEFAVIETTLCLFAYGLGLLPATLVILYSSLSFAKGDFRTPTLISLFAILLNLGLNALFIFGFQWGSVSTALATSLSAFANFFILKRQAHQRGWSPLLSLKDHVYIGAASFIAAFCAWGTEMLLFIENGPLTRVFTAQVLHFCVPAFAFLASLTLSAYLLRVEIVIDLMRALKPEKSVNNT